MEQITESLPTDLAQNKVSTVKKKILFSIVGALRSSGILF
jgi:hypothetical protein